MQVPRRVVGETDLLIRQISPSIRVAYLSACRSREASASTANPHRSQLFGCLHSRGFQLVTATNGRPCLTGWGLLPLSHRQNLSNRFIVRRYSSKNVLVTPGIGHPIPFGSQRRGTNMVRCGGFDDGGYLNINQDIGRSEGFDCGLNSRANGSLDPAAGRYRTPFRTS